MARCTHTYIQTDMGHVQHVYVGLAQAQLNNSKWGTLPIRRILSVTHY